MATHSPPRAGRREWIGLAVLALPTLLLAMDMTVLHLAIPSLTADLRPTTSQMLWILDIYGFLIAGFLLTMGTLGDRIGRRRLLLIGGAAFGATSVLAAFSTSAEMLILARALLGIAGATLMPSTLSLIRTMFHDPAQRTVAVSVWMTCFAVGGALGPLLGGLMLGRFEWGSVFLLGVPVMLLLLVLGPFLLPEHKNADAGRLDLISAVLSLTAILSVVYGLKVLAEDGPSTAPLAFLALGLLTGLVFVRRQRTIAHPLVDLTLFRNRTFSTAAALLTVGVMVMAGSQLFTLQYLQLVEGLSPLQAGLWSLPNAAGLMVGAMSAPALAARTRPGPVIAGGLALTAVALASLTLVGATDGLLILVASSTLMGVGLGPMVALGTDLIVGSAPVERSGTASALSETSTELGAGLGIAVMGSIGFGVYRSRVSESAPEGVDVHTARESLGAAVDLARVLGDPLGTELLTAAREAFVSGLHVTATVGGVTALVMAVLAALLLKRTPEAEKGDGSPDDRSAEPTTDGPVRETAPTGS
ncbi:MFS transporter [Nocardiopsis lambiniae]|uniref:MFS transporter n=1 Tax=Nocardiopsis lambiniae TaxID=3075539 RepID=A0ABU2MAY4_9ACTN|nr:MFS transporter [Nocardiopsis sp. DSM 44743]MDT0329697.1 MFS transporter [Nocardiopsis sp. DSM 44743]